MAVSPPYLGIPHSNTLEGSILYKGHKITYCLTWKKVKNLNLRVLADGSVVVSAPMHTPLATVEEFLLHKAPWILHSQQKLHDLALQAPSPTPNTVLYLGEALELRPHYAPQPRVEFVPGALLIHTPQPQDCNTVSRIAESWLTEQAHLILPHAMERALSLFSSYPLATPSDVRLRKMKSRWGSCQPSTGVVTLNIRLIHVPYCCIVAVAAHELAHFLHPNHSAAFYAVLHNALPQYPQHKQLLSSFAKVLQL